MPLINVKAIKGVFSGSQNQEMVKEHEQIPAKNPLIINQQLVKDFTPFVRLFST